MKADLPGTVVFIFQPAEEGAPTGEEGGASAMIKDGALQNPSPEAIFGLHVWTNTTGDIDLRPGSLMASAAGLKIVVHGKQTHGAQPWRGVDPIVVASQIVLGLQTITSRELDLRKGAAVITVGAINGGNRGNIIPDSVVMIGTVRTFVPGMEKQIAELVKRTAEGIAASAGATATTEVEGGYSPTINDPALVAKMLPSLRRVAGSKVDADMTPLTPSPRTSRRTRRRSRACSSSWASCRRAPIRPRRRPTIRRISSPTRRRCPWACARWRASPWTTWRVAA